MTGGRLIRWIATGLSAAGLACPALAQTTSGNSIEVLEAWTPATTRTGMDWPLYMTLINHGDTSDNLVRIRCPADLVDFVEKHVIDHGEGGVAMREVKTLAIPANGVTKLMPGIEHLMMLDVRTPLQEGSTFACTVAFQKAGTTPVEVKVTSPQ